MGKRLLQESVEKFESQAFEAVNLLDFQQLEKVQKVGLFWLLYKCLEKKTKVFQYTQAQEWMYGNTLSISLNNVDIMNYITS